MVTRDFGEIKTANMGYSHEYMQNNGNTNIRNFSREHEIWADETVDLLNNQIGREIGRKNPKANNNGIATIIAGVMKDEGTWSVNPNEDGGYSVSKTKITEEQHKMILNAIKLLDENGNKK